jgi:hypothetical protein
MLGHYVFNASAIGLGGILTSPKRKVIPSLASVALAPTGGEGASIVTNYDDGDGISFDRAETRVWGSSHNGNIYATRADVILNNLDVFSQLQVESMWASVTSIREVLENGDVLDRKFTFQAEFLGVRVNGKEIDVPVDTTVFDENASYEKFVDALGSDKMADYRKMIGIDDATQMIVKSQRGRGIEDESLSARTIRCTAMAPRGQSGFHVDVKGIGRAHLAEVLIKPGRRRLTLMRLELTGRTMPHMGSDGADLATAAAQTRDAVLLTRSGPGGDGSMSVGSVEGNGTNTWP